jgi:rhodanese-related sulfurtransferase
VGILSSLFPPSTTPQEAYEAMRRRELILLDVRTTGEWKKGHAPGARHLPASTLRAQAKKLPAGRRYAAVCRTGSRSKQATAQLRRLGLDVVNVKGGMTAWERAGLPLEPRNARIA